MGEQAKLEALIGGMAAAEMYVEGLGDQVDADEVIAALRRLRAIEETIRTFFDDRERQLFEQAVSEAMDLDPGGNPR